MKRILILPLLLFALPSCTSEELRTVANVGIDVVCGNLSAVSVGFETKVAAGKINGTNTRVGRASIITVQSACNNRPYTKENAMRAAISAFSQVVAMELAAR